MKKYIGLKHDKIKKILIITRLSIDELYGILSVIYFFKFDDKIKNIDLVICCKRKNENFYKKLLNGFIDNVLKQKILEKGKIIFNYDFLFDENDFCDLYKEENYRLENFITNLIKIKNVNKDVNYFFIFNFVYESINILHKYTSCNLLIVLDKNSRDCAKEIKKMKDKYNKIYLFEKYKFIGKNVNKKDALHEKDMIKMVLSGNRNYIFNFVVYLNLIEIENKSLSCIDPIYFSCILLCFCKKFFDNVYVDEKENFKICDNDCGIYDLNLNYQEEMYEILTNSFIKIFG